MNCSIIVRLILAVFLFTGARVSAEVPDNQLTAAEKKSGWRLLFDGETLNGWMTSELKPSRKPVEDGCINPHQCGHYMMVHTQQWSDLRSKLILKSARVATVEFLCAPHR